jgi:hemerythrin superfamily protein
MSDAPAISAFYQDDHDRLDALFQAFQTSKRQDLSKAKEAFSQFASGLKRHIRWEEDLLFPLWEDKTGMSDGGPTFVMRHEHRLIEERLKAIARNVAEQTVDDDQAEQALLTLLGAHNLKEERVLYPSIDQVTTPAECEEIFQKMQDIPEDDKLH